MFESWRVRFMCKVVLSLHRFKRALLIAKASGGRFILLRHVKPPLPFRVNGKTFEIMAPESEGTKFTYSEILAEDGYRLKPLRSTPMSTIVDIGANIGLFTCYAAALFPMAEVHAYEPSPDAYEWLTNNIINFQKVNIYPYAVSAKFKKAIMPVVKDITTGYIQDCSHAGIEVQCINPTDIAPGKNIDLLKLDCEGSEFDILTEISLLKRTKYCSMEFHLSEKNTIRQLLELIDLGMHKVIGSIPSSLSEEIATGYIYTQHRMIEEF